MGSFSSEGEEVSGQTLLSQSETGTAAEMGDGGHSGSASAHSTAETVSSSPF